MCSIHRRRVVVRAYRLRNSDHGKQYKSPRFLWPFLTTVALGKLSAFVFGCTIHAHALTHTHNAFAWRIDKACSMETIRMWRMTECGWRKIERQTATTNETIRIWRWRGERNDEGKTYQIVQLCGEFQTEVKWIGQVWEKWEQERHNNNRPKHCSNVKTVTRMLHRYTSSEQRVTENGCRKTKTDAFSAIQAKELWYKENRAGEMTTTTITGSWYIREKQ